MQIGTLTHCNRNRNSSSNSNSNSNPNNPPLPLVGLRTDMRGTHRLLNRSNLEAHRLHSLIVSSSNSSMHFSVVEVLGGTLVL